MIKQKIRYEPILKSYQTRLTDEEIRRMERDDRFSRSLFKLETTINDNPSAIRYDGN